MALTECQPYSVSEYHFADDKDECVSFHVLPVQWSDGERLDGEKVEIFLHGTADNGGDLCKHVVAWKFDISSEEPEILVLSEENSWIKLGKPRKSFEDTVRSILITVHCLHYVKRNPEKPGDSVWNHLSEVFRLYVVRPSQSDLVDHMPLIGDCVNRYRALADSKFLAKLFEEKTMKRKLSDEDTEARKKLRIMIGDEKDGMILAEDEDIDNLFGEVCALCDDGGKIICCEGGCLRSFHATEEAGAGSYCKSLGFMQDDVVGTQNFYCKNCEHKQHQCFVCGKLGSSDKSSGAAEVVSCVSPNCGRFYHPHCVATLLYQDNGVPAKELERKISGGESFTCPIHKCCICKQGENKKDSELQFAVCMGCPKSYHRKCLPREIAFENQGEELEGRSIIRAWDGLLPNRILIYCTKHDIDIEFGTVRRDHIKFPDVKQNMSTLKKKKKTILEEKWKPISEFLVDGDKVVTKRNISLEKSYRDKNAPTALTTQKPYVQEKKTRKLMSEQKPVSKKSNSSEESVGERSDPVLSTLVKQKHSSVKKKKATFVQEKTFVEEKESQLTSTVSVDREKAVSKRRTPSSEGLYSEKSAPTISKKKQKPSFVEEKNNNLVKKKTIVEEKRKRTSESLVERETAVSKKKNPSSKESYGERNASTTPKQKQQPSVLTVDGDEAGSKKGSPLEESLSAIASTVPKLKQKSTSAVKLGSNKNREKTFSGIDISRMVKRNNSLKNELQASMSEKIKTSLSEEPFSSMESEQVKLGNLDTPDANTASEIHKEMPPHTECGDDGNQHPDPSKSRMHCAPANGRVQFKIPDDAGRKCTTSNDEPRSSVTNPTSGNEKGCKRENSGKPYSNGTKQKQKLRTEFDRVPPACIKGKQDPIFSRGFDLAGQNSVHDHIRTFSSTFYSHIGHVADLLSSTNGLAMPSDATKLVGPRAPQPGYLDRCMGFAPGPQLNYSLQNSAGWIDE
ncbi:protein ENHANCED DOWNY MILDEW 2-like [Rosa sericea]